MQPQQGYPNGLPTSQMDGSGDSPEAVLMQRGPDGNPVEMGRVEIDRMIHAQIAARFKQMEGGGLMLPLRQATKTRSVPGQKRTGRPGQFDGMDDELVKDEDVDLDAVNSDLDDTIDIGGDDDEEDESGYLMLCMYDKVQRVKNKWYVHRARSGISAGECELTNPDYRKCTLKDGVLTINGREYVFHKATGEYEW
jgi:transcription initiation factor TFIIA large subunit